MKNVIYCVYEKPLDWHGDYGPISLPRIEEYASCVGADFKVLNNDFLPPIIREIKAEFVDKGLDQPINFFCLAMSKMWLHHELIKSDYERMLVLDADIYVTKNAENIFEDKNYENGLTMQKLGVKYADKIRHDIKLYYDEEVDNCYYGPIVISDRSTSSHIVNNFLPDKYFLKAAESMKYYGEERGNTGDDYEMKNPKAPKVHSITEEHLNACLLKKAGVSVNEINPRKWLGGMRRFGEPDYRPHMYHLAGGDKKYFFDKEVLNKMDSLE